MAARLWKPLEREIALDGQRFILRIELGGGSATGDVMVRVRRVGAHSWSFSRNLTLALRTALASGARVQTLNL